MKVKKKNVLEMVTLGEFAIALPLCLIMFYFLLSDECVPQHTVNAFQPLRRILHRPACSNCK